MCLHGHILSDRLQLPFCVWREGGEGGRSDRGKIFSYYINKASFFQSKSGARHRAYRAWFFFFFALWDGAGTASPENVDSPPLILKMIKEKPVYQAQYNTILYLTWVKVELSHLLIVQTLLYMYLQGHDLSNRLQLIQLVCEYLSVQLDFLATALRKKLYCSCEMKSIKREPLWD